MRPAQLLICFLAISCTTAAQNVGIGTSSPAGKLHITGTADTTQLLIDANTVQSNGKPLIKLRNSSGTDLLSIHSDHPTNTFVGLSAGELNNVGGGGTANTFTGSSAGYHNTTGSYNTVNGYDALFFNSTGSRNTALGYGTLGNSNDGSNNTAIGYQAILQNNHGNNNTALGYQSLSQNNNGNNNTAIGYQSLSQNNTGSNNIAIGFGSGNLFTNLNNNVGIGNDGVYLHGASNQVILGNFSSVFIGGKVNWGIVSDGRIKKDIQEDVKGLDFISRLRPVTYYISSSAMMAVTGTKPTPDFAGKYDGDKIKYSGFIAQEVEQAANASGYEFSGYNTPKNESGLYSIKYAEFVVPLVKAVQEQQAIIEQQQRKIEQQQQQYEILLKRMEVLEKKN